ncbi:MAG: translation-associated GTPase [Candidatus Pacearchaeota archaeon]|nr:MAG: translation-associated GTPase [Candidatus Pacearchaeota archaeon]
MLIGLVGKPSAGKSTFFKAATLVDVAIASYPFTTIKPNHGIGYVKVECIENEFNVKCQPRHGFCINGKRFVPIEIIDVAGLVPGASEGKGLGNQFLDDLRQADVFIHIVDCSGTTDSEGKITKMASHDPIKDIEFLEEELDKWYYGILIKAWKSFCKKIESNKDLKFSEEVSKQFSGLKVSEEDVKKTLFKLNLSDKPSNWSQEELFNFASSLRKESKKTIIAANKIDLEKSKENYERIKKRFPDMKIVPCSSEYELILREASKNGFIDYIPGEKEFVILKDLNDKQKEILNEIKNFLETYGSTGIQEILNIAVFDLLGYIAVFPAGSTKLKDSEGRILPDCFLINKGSTALDFAFLIHTDLGKNFVKAIDVRTKKILGKDYELKNRDAIEIITR